MAPKITGYWNWRRLSLRSVRKAVDALLKLLDGKHGKTLLHHAVSLLAIVQMSQSVEEAWENVARALSTSGTMRNGHLHLQKLHDPAESENFRYTWKLIKDSCFVAEQTCNMYCILPALTIRAFGSPFIYYWKVYWSRIPHSDEPLYQEVTTEMHFKVLHFCYIQKALDLYVRSARNVPCKPRCISVK